MARLRSLVVLRVAPTTSLEYRAAARLLAPPKSRRPGRALSSRKEPAWVAAVLNEASAGLGA